MKSLPLTETDARTLRMLRAIANPVRFRIVQTLAARDVCVCGEIASELPISQSTVSEHLAVLKDAGIVQGTVSGPNSCYCLDADALRFLVQALQRLTPVDCCDGATCE